MDWRTGVTLTTCAYCGPVAAGGLGADGGACGSGAADGDGAGGVGGAGGATGAAGCAGAAVSSGAGAASAGVPAPGESSTGATGDGTEVPAGACGFWQAASSRQAEARGSHFEVYRVIRDRPWRVRKLSPDRLRSGRAAPYPGAAEPQVPSARGATCIGTRLPSTPARYQRPCSRRTAPITATPVSASRSG